MKHDDAFERLLRRTLRRDMAAGACPDPATLAALTEGTLAADERDLVESHASSCSRCAAELALLARTADVPGAAGAAPPKAFQVPWRWAVPLVTAVLVFVVWSETDRPEQEAARGPAAPQVEAPAPARRRQAPPSLAEKPAETDRDAAFRYEPPAMEDQAAAPPSAAAPSAGRTVPDAQAKAAPTPPVSAAGDASPKDEREERRAEGVAEKRPPSAPAADPMELSKDRQSSPGQFEVLADRASTFVLRGPGAVRIRVGSAGIERSTDGGATWQVESAAPPGRTRAGVCPGPEVCWLGADGGRILKRDASGRWTEFRLPVDDAVAGIASDGAEQATATTARARRFSTTDGGRTWSPLP